MTRISGLLIVALFCGTLAAQQARQPEMKLEKSDHDFGRILNKGGNVSYKFGFVNAGDVPLVISKVETSCECTTAAFDKKPVMPGDSSRITITYNPRRQSGSFYKAIQVFSNEKAVRRIIVVQGEVVKGK